MTSRQKNQKTKNIFFQISAIVILLAAIVYYFEAGIAKYMMIAGVAGFTAVVFTSPYRGKSLRAKRLFNIQIFAVLLMAVSAYLMFVDINFWPVILLVSAILTLYCTIILPKEE
ncbi:hypothetical protein [Dysgonomonas sp. 511]|uniref:hypothetical protein n=1 Tax=Dysgonomonas sp. 511 TaxID=2302930 RepID=UPI0013D71049|nr:hypothetical protein [Dysgonomonas sp. 511]NDV78009.1 hypothetical protein [Dysgonomonas sp. 511]